MRVLGVDPGSAVCGYGVVEGRAGNPQFVAAGTIRSTMLAPGPKRLHRIHDHLLAIIDEFAPDSLSLERHFVAINVQSAFRLGEARAMAMLAAAERNLEFFEYPPNAVKLCVAGHGHADKAQVKYMVRRTLKLDPSLELADDAADALAVAMCHLGRGRIPNMVESVERSRPAAARSRSKVHPQ
ncbi:MAG: crossover junction endodeoxyribonuclease RuvC [Candidatus Binatus sp.]|uniref:crossover junction endodeoxyribonuclease RuvC n=1 Tax=Candidatus Binatus sp. TaxID=2811406 RepID=UPI0027244BBC|nr:crossover junction endodeoxyribonuclease RuvC [Candidatus Binatus sp.]MDO8431204.1 crossover junction endodeoxyribonuclease RuvC [Candidatus Binatus sp.]